MFGGSIKHRIMEKSNKRFWSINQKPLPKLWQDNYCDQGRSVSGNRKSWMLILISQISSLLLVYWLNTFVEAFLNSFLSFQTMLLNNHATIAAHSSTRWSLIALARRQNAKLEAHTSITRDSRATVDNPFIHWRRHSAQQSPAARDGARSTLQSAISTLPETWW